jgi:hypothetical protein
MEVFNNAIIEINNKHNPVISFDFLGENEEFGILNIKANKAPITTSNTLFLFTIDITGSMNERTTGRITKLDIVKQTFKSMLNYLSTIDAPIYIRLHCFNTEVSVIMETILIKNKEDLTTLYNKIDGLFADNSTNIEAALKGATEYMDKYSEENPSHQICHVFMTDGYATIGITNENSLCQLVSDKYSGIFIGFGKDHNIQLMKKMTNKSNAVYQFINDMEDTSLIYGETIHQYLYPAARNIEIQFTDCLVYDWKNNVWTDKLIEGIISSEANKIYHIKKTSDAAAYASVYGVPHWAGTNESLLLDIVHILPKLINFDTNTENIVDLTNYMFRQKTMELLFDANVIDNPTEFENLRNKIRSLFNEIRQYMREESILDDGFMNQLCDDLCITYRNIGTNTGNMFILARHTSQGRQQTYSATPKSCRSDQETEVYSQSPFDLPVPSTPRPRMLKRSITGTIHRFPPMDEYDEFQGVPVVENQNDNEDEIVTSEIDTYVITGNNTSCYANNSTLNTMSQMTQVDP